MFQAMLPVCKLHRPLLSNKYGLFPPRLQILVEQRCWISTVRCPATCPAVKTLPDSIHDYQMGGKLKHLLQLEHTRLLCFFPWQVHYTWCETPFARVTLATSLGAKALHFAWCCVAQSLLYLPVSPMKFLMPRLKQSCWSLSILVVRSDSSGHTIDNQPASRNLEDS